MPRRKSISNSLVSDFEPRKKNPLGLLDDANLDAHLKSIKIGDKLAPIQISDDEVRFDADFSLNGKLKMHRIETDNQYLHLIAREGENNGYIVNQAAYVRQTDSSGLYPYDVYNVSAVLYKIGHSQVLEYASNGNYQFHGGTTSFIEMKYADNSFNIYNKDDSGDYFKILCDTHGATTLSTVDDDASAANLTLDVDGDIELNADGGDITLKDALSSMALFNIGSTRFFYDSNNLFRITCGATGIATLTTTGGTATDADFLVDAGGDISLDSGTGVFIAKKAGTEFSVANSAYAGMILGYRMIGEDGAHDTYAITTSMVVPDAAMTVRFIAPPSGAVEVMVQFFQDTASGRTITVGLSDNATYNSIGDSYQQATGLVDESDTYVHQHYWTVTGLTAGSTYNYWFGLKSTGGVGNTMAWGGTGADRYCDFIMKVTALPTTTADFAVYG